MPSLGSGKGDGRPRHATAALIPSMRTGSQCSPSARCHWYLPRRQDIDTVGWRQHINISCLAGIALRLLCLTSSRLATCGRMAMLHRISMAAITLVWALGAMTAAAQAWDDSKYPDLGGQWVRAEGGRG